MVGAGWLDARAAEVGWLVEQRLLHCAGQPGQRHPDQSHPQRPDNAAITSHCAVTFADDVADALSNGP